MDIMERDLLLKKLKLIQKLDMERLMGKMATMMMMVMIMDIMIMMVMIMDIMIMMVMIMDIMIMERDLLMPSTMNFHTMPMVSLSHYKLWTRGHKYTILFTYILIID